MNTEIIRTLDDPPAPAPTTPMQLLDAAVRSGVDAAQLEKLMDLQERWEANQARKAFALARAKFQARCPRIIKTGHATINMKSGGQYGYDFPKLDEIMLTIQPHLEACGLSVSFTDFVVHDGMCNLNCTVMHSEGHSERFPFAVPVDNSLSINSMQQVGVANSYAKRYALCNALALVGTDADTDGHISEPPAPEPKATDEQLASIQEYRDEGKIPDVTLKWLDKKGESLTSKEAATLLAKLRKADAGR